MLLTIGGPAGLRARVLTQPASLALRASPRRLREHPPPAPQDSTNGCAENLDAGQNLVKLAAQPLARDYLRHADVPPSASSCQDKAEATSALHFPGHRDGTRQRASNWLAVRASRGVPVPSVPSRRCQDSQIVRGAGTHVPGFGDRQLRGEVVGRTLSFWRMAPSLSPGREAVVVDHGRYRGGRDTDTDRPSLWRPGLMVYASCCHETG